MNRDSALAIVQEYVTNENLIRHMLQNLPYDGRDEKEIGEIDDKILGQGPGFVGSG